MSNSSRQFLIAIFILALFGCASNSPTTSIVYCESCDNSVWKDHGDAGGIILNNKLTGKPEWLQGTANSYCQQRGFPQGGVVDYSSRGKDYDALFDKVSYRFSCTGSKTQGQDNLKIAQPDKEVKTTKSVDEAKNKCRELGFKQGTEEFGKCALQLSK